MLLAEPPGLSRLRLPFRHSGSAASVWVRLEATTGIEPVYAVCRPGHASASDHPRCLHRAQIS
jgi:hypothetical protein